MGIAKNLIGKRFGKLIIIKKLSSGNDGVRWLCKCDCGNETIVTTHKLNSGNTKSCGCLVSAVNKTHGLSNTRQWKIWEGIKQRCFNINHPRYKDYGGRNITMCDEWANNFMSFYDWSMKNNYDDYLTLDRIDVDKGYNPDNCRWVDNNTQAHNKRLDKLYTYNGKTLSVRDWCKEIGFYWSIFKK